MGPSGQLERPPAFVPGRVPNWVFRAVLTGQPARGPCWAGEMPYGFLGPGVWTGSPWPQLLPQLGYSRLTPRSDTDDYLVLGSWNFPETAPSLGAGSAGTQPGQALCPRDRRGPRTRSGVFGTCGEWRAQEPQDDAASGLGRN